LKPQKAPPSIDQNIAGFIESASQEELRALSNFFYLAQDLIIVHDLEGRFIYFNEAVCTQRGYKKEEIQHMTIQALDTPEASALFEEHKKELMKSGSAVFESVQKCKDGRIVPVEVHARLIDIQGRRLVLSICRDITDRKKTFEALREAERLLSAITDTSSDAIYVKDRQSHWLFANPALARIAGKPLTELLGKTDAEIYANQDVARVILENDHRIMESGRPETVEEFVDLPDGRHFFISVKAPRFDEKGKVIGLVGISHDITNIKETENKLRASQVWDATFNYSRNLIEASLDPFVTISAEGKITDANKATEMATGCSREELVGSDFSTYFTEPEKAAAGYKQAFEEGYMVDFPLAIKHKNGKIFDVLYNASVYVDLQGNVQGIFAAARDITERKRLERELQDKERLAAIGATAGMVGHDIRNPLQAIVSDIYLARLELLELTNDDHKENLKEALDEIEENVEYINKIVLDLQDFARPLNPRIERVDVKTIIEEILEKTPAAKTVEIAVEIGRRAQELMSDADYLKRILSNLALNALQAMPNGGKLTFKSIIDPDTDEVVLTVKDTGIGIPEDVKKKLFTPMFTTKSKGQGFGLAVVKRLTEALDGTITFESAQGKGTTFRLLFPSSKS
jgi:PAS domain S-box-containing protein